MATPPPRIDAGIFNVARPSYSPATMQLMKVLMEETKVPKLQQRLFEQSLRSGQPLPDIRRSRPSQARERRQRPATNQRADSGGGRRTLNTIAGMESGQPPIYRPAAGRDRDAERERLAHVMTYGRDARPDLTGSDRTTDENTNKSTPAEDRFDELWREVEERRQFLHEMKQLGRARQYEPIIRGEVARLVQEMEQLQRERDDQ